MSDIPPSSEQQPTPEQQEVGYFIHRLHSCQPRTPTTTAILIANFLVFGFMLLQGAALMNPDIEVFIQYGANYGPLTKDDGWWRLFSAMFLHFGIVHVLFNMWALWDAGRLTERLYGSAHFAILYLFAGLAGSLASLLWNNDDVVSVGASGAVFGVFGALLAYLLRQKISIPKQLLKQLATSALFFMGFSLFYGFAKSGIDNAAHIGGLIAGFILGLLFARPICESDQGYRKLISATLISSLCVAFAIAMTPPAVFKYQDQVDAEQKLRHFVEQEKTLMQNWRDLTVQLKNGKDIREADSLQVLNTIQAEWLSLEQDLTSYGDIRDVTADTMRKLGEYATYRSRNARYLIRYLETADIYYMQQLKENNKQVEKILNEINSATEN